jgi:exocyst complex component 2
MFETLMFLVGIHSQIMSVASDGALVDRTLSYLVVQLADEALQCFKQVQKFGMGGMLRVRAITTFGSYTEHDPGYP